MRRWIPTRNLIFAGLRGQKLRCFSTVVNDVERVSIRNGSSGTITIDLHNLAKVSSLDPLLVYLPPYSTVFTEKPAQLPLFMQRQPTAVINYRWTGFTAFEAEDFPAQSGEDGDTHLSWPTPIHDAARAYDWIVENLGPSTYTRRDIYLYGSYLGASLATSLALTETHPHARMGVRGCVAYNGIYNWTMFLPDHPIHQLPKLRMTNILEKILSQPDDPVFRELRQHAEALFGRPDNLFDPFASPCLFFHTPGLLVPPAFDASAIHPAPDLSVPEEDPLGIFAPAKPPRKSALVFPPRKSTLKIPETLLLHSTPPPLPPSLLRRRQRRKKEPLGNSFAAQAEELAALMRRSIDKLELKERFRWDDHFEDWDGEAARRVQVSDVGLNAGDFELDGKGEEMAAAWLEDHISHAR
ncbi:hypothetical protein F4818DRAFT_409186 [Hypoxylon cercidicola]|nr:hypothetical protein F4818DRAFT_409186 [Hypoxylon cercidicola]